MRALRTLSAVLFLVASGSAHAQTYCVPDGMRAYFSYEQTLSNRQGSSASPLNADARPGFAAAARVGNYAAAFDGKDDFLRYGFLDAGFQNMSVVFWMRPNTTDGIQTLFDEGGFTHSIAIRINDGTLEAAAREDEVQVSFTHQTPVQPGVWQHVALVYEAGVVSLYLDGIADTDPDGDTGFGGLPSHGNDGGFGATLQSDAFGEGDDAPNATTNFYEGLLDETAYYRGNGEQNALTPDQIEATIACDPNVPFECTADVYVAQGSDTSLRRVDVTTSPFEFVPVDEPVAFEYNAAGYNPQDDFAYAFKRGSTDRSILRVAADGTVTDLGPLRAIAGANADIYSGDVSPDGVYYLAHVVGTADSLTAIDLSTAPYTVEKRALSINIGRDVADLAFNPIDGLLYGISTTDRDVLAIDPSTGEVSLMPVLLPNGSRLPAGPYGAMWFNAVGQFFTYFNPGRIYRIDLSGETPAATLVSTGPSTSRNDGFACATAPVAADVVLDKEVVEEPDAPIEAGDAFVYTIDLTNNGPSIATNVVMEDALPDGLAFVAVQVDSAATGGALDPDRYVLDLPDAGTNGTVSVTLLDLALGAPNAVRITLQADALSPLPVRPTNTASIASADQDDPNSENNEDTVGGPPVASEPGAATLNLRFAPPHPNPVRDRVVLSYTLQDASEVTLEVFDSLGRRVGEFADRRESAGQHEVVIDASHLPAGTYFCVLRAGSATATQRFTRLR